MKKRLRIATRQSPLALWQADEVARQLRQRHPNLDIEQIKIVTEGDRFLDKPLFQIGGKGLFINALEHSILDGTADIAVHSIKDIPSELASGLVLSAILPRDDPRDALVSTRYPHLETLPKGAVIGTTSLRRQCQLKSLRPTITLKNLRGNVNTRLNKLDQGEYDAIVLAYAGLKRLGLTHRIAMPFAPEMVLPAVGQGAIGIESRADDQEITDLLRPLNDDDSARCIDAERAMNARLEGNCQVPIAGYAIIDDGQLWLRGRVGRVDGRLILNADARGDNAITVGQQVAEALLAQGANTVLQDIETSD